MGFTVVESEITHIVLRLVAIGIFLDLETVQGEAERQRNLCDFVLFLDVEMTVGTVGFEFHPAVLSREHGEQGTQQDEQDGEMQGADGQPIPQTAFHRHNDDEASHHGPQPYEPPCRIDMGKGEVRAVQFLDDGAGGKDGDEYDDQH